MGTRSGDPLDSSRCVRRPGKAPQAAVTLHEREIHAPGYFWMGGARRDTRALAKAADRDAVGPSGLAAGPLRRTLTPCAGTCDGHRLRGRQLYRDGFVARSIGRGSMTEEVDSTPPRFSKQGESGYERTAGSA